MKKYLFFLFLLYPTFCLSNPRYQLPETPSEIWQNDLDLFDYARIHGFAVSAGQYCVDSPTFCVDVVNNSVIIGTTTYTTDVQFKVNQSMFVYTNGTITQPLQPSFLATAPSNTANVTGDGTVVTVEYDTEIFDLNSDFDTTTYKFTAPVTGKYIFAANVLGSADAAAGNTTFNMTLVTSNRNYQSYNNDVLGAYPFLNVTVVADMDAGDTAYVTIDISGATKIVEVHGSANYCFFSGSLIN